MTRAETPHIAPEYETLKAFLDHQRDTLAWKCEGLGDEELRQQNIEPSPLSLMGLLRHMADVERGWFRRVIAGENAPPHFWHADGSETDFTKAADDTRESAFALWREEVAASRAIGEKVTLDDVVVHPRSGGEYSVRWIYVHMIEEYARHNGHADLLRERIDGATGE
ncbi:DinB family protein [Nonomuraea sp. NPDC050663]|uniref:DinB family protein n=1 Tax=Nonomuraea sp. NPDC050663 TaxID=3364370 RepID=UPI0037A78788